MCAGRPNGVAKRTLNSPIDLTEAASG